MDVVAWVQKTGSTRELDHVVLGFSSVLEMYSGARLKKAMNDQGSDSLIWESSGEAVDG